MYRDSFFVDVLFFVEHKDRELEVIIEVAKILKQQGKLRIAIASSIFDRFNSIFFVRPKVVVFHTNKGLPHIFYRFYGESIEYVCLNWEQMISVFNKRTYKKPKDRFTKDVLKHCAWGSDFKSFLMENGILSRNIYITGKPAVTLLRRKALASSAIKEELSAKYGISKNLRWFFFPLTCLHAFFSDDVVRSFVKNQELSGEIDERLAFARRNYVRESVQEIFSWLVKLNEVYDETYIIILRPHPISSVEHHEQLFEKINSKIPPYVLISKDFTAQEWLIASDKCYTNYSSVALDAYFINKKAYLLEPIPFPDFLKYEWFNGFQRLDNCDDFKKSIVENNQQKVARSEILDKEFDLNLNGIEETAKILGNFSANISRYPKINKSTLWRTAIREPQKDFGLGSFVRFVTMSLKINKFVEVGRQYDFFTKKEVKYYLKSGRNPDFKYSIS